MAEECMESFPQPIPHLPSLSGHRHHLACALHNPQQEMKNLQEVHFKSPSSWLPQQARELGDNLTSQTRLSLFVISKPLKKGGASLQKEPSLHHNQVGYSKKGVLGTAYGFGEKETGGLRKIKSVSEGHLDWAAQVKVSGRAGFIAPPVV